MKMEVFFQLIQLLGPACGEADIMEHGITRSASGLYSNFNAYPFCVHGATKQETVVGF
jgi:hypothetical protein